MTSQLKVSVGQHTDKGPKKTNQDFHGVYIPKEPQLSSKGVAIALADGISSSAVSHIASESAVTGFFADYYCTSDAWSVKTSAQRVLMATNSWLHSQGQQSPYRFDPDRGYVCTFSAMIIKSTTAHLFHAGDSRIYRVLGNALEQLTNDHRMWVSEDKSYLSRALGIHPQLDLDYRAEPVDVGDTFILATDGVYEYVSASSMLGAIAHNTDDLDAAAQAIVKQALEQGSDDNLTVQILRIDALPLQQPDELYQQLTELPFPPVLEARAEFDGYTIVREVHASSRSHVYLATDNDTLTPVIIKTPSIDLQRDVQYLERFLTEEWVARRINSAHVVKPCLQTRKRNYLYSVSEYIEGQTLAQWMIDNPRPDLETVRGIIEQIAKGVRAFHRLEMLHQDLRPANVMIDATGTVKIIDFGSTRVAGIMEITSPIERSDLLGTAQYTAPEYFLGESGSMRSDQFSLAVIAYQMLTGGLPYGAAVARCRTRAALNKLSYQPIREHERGIPGWIDEVLRKALHPDPYKRYEDLSEFVFELRQPNQAFLNKARPPLMERNPVLFWKGVSLVLAVAVGVLLLR
ncbi:bifunctional protein-serine/threonine kinase/phosphatase [Stutzerimonas zhaodongensis]|uniref:Bifunctional protein-serine/threonine kinase/phosphatase n=1 Tax=Stutzerimonas zhaodongensis TaxID=1176257 RepID=A0A3M2HW97_9GAMM|nr:bifunctional protein-serine/threonine kinase/phosphatase [Stutzerimonas zhaodongensis]MCQ4318520.1 bifunctional protein-serine/threonine kinase/phosphatase [Stutzerimonas zhaodongensis]RMH91930.1 bifunctional protein-serine/threonine kinase/phosphatase [Stutzerimonas zhaodongensis]